MKNSTKKKLAEKINFQKIQWIKLLFADHKNKKYNKNISTDKGIIIFIDEFFIFIFFTITTTTRVMLKIYCVWHTMGWRFDGELTDNLWSTLHHYSIINILFINFYSCEFFAKKVYLFLFNISSVNKNKKIN